MSLRLDPKYHGVRVARVRPKDSALVNPDYAKHLRFRTQRGWLIIPGRGRLEFIKFLSLVEPSYQKFAYAALIDGVRYLEEKEALEALGLR